MFVTGREPGSALNELYTLLRFSERAAVIGLREKSAAWIRDGLAALQPRKYWLLTIGRGSLFAAVVGSSFIEGVSPYETPERLARFRAVIDAIMVKYSP